MMLFQTAGLKFDSGRFKCLDIGLCNFKAANSKLSLPAQLYAANTGLKVSVIHFETELDTRRYRHLPGIGESLPSVDG